MQAQLLTPYYVLHDASVLMVLQLKFATKTDLNLPKILQTFTCCLQVDPTFLQEFLQSFDVTQLSRDERNLLIVYHSHSGAAMRFLNDHQLAELRVR